MGIGEICLWSIWLLQLIFALLQPIHEPYFENPDSMRVVNLVVVAPLQPGPYTAI